MLPQRSQVGQGRLGGGGVVERLVKLLNALSVAANCLVCFCLFVCLFPQENVQILKDLSLLQIQMRDLEGFRVRRERERERERT